MSTRRPPLEALIAALDYPAAEGLSDALWLASHLPAQKIQARSAPLRSRDLSGEYLPVPLGIQAAGEHLQNPVALTRALRPLRRTVPSRTMTELDAQATAHMIAKDPDGLWLPVRRPTGERWLGLTVIADRSASMTIWQSWIGETTKLLRQTGIFRYIRQWQIDSDQPQLWLSAADGTMHGPHELIDPAGRHIILIMSDCVGRAWHGWEMSRLMQIWSRTREGAVTVVHPFPERMWTRLGPQLIKATVRTRESDRPGLSIAPEDPAQASSGPPVLVIRFTTDWLHWWASLLTERRPGTHPAEALVPGMSHREEFPAPLPESPRETVGKFRAYASPAAFQLAVRIAAAPVDLPTMLFIQSLATHPQEAQAGRVHLAEVILGNLLERADDHVSTPVTPDEMRYDFPPGVREILLSHLDRTEAIRLLQAIGTYLRARNDTPSDFAVVTPAGRIPVPTKPFAIAAERVLHTLGGAYADTAAKLQAWGSPMRG